MGKHRHSKDKQYITRTEYKEEWGGKKDPTKTPMTQLPFYCCSLGLQPFQNPVCTNDGVLYELINIIPFIKKFKQCPVTGKSLKINDLIKVKFHKNQKGEYHDPISFKTFTDHTVIVMIKPSGNVYSNDTVEELNKKPKIYKDLITSEPFTPKDIIILQDPKNIQNRTIKNFNHIQNQITFDQVQIPSKPKDFMNENSTVNKVLEQVNEKNKQEEKIREQKLLKEQQEIEEIIKKQQSNQESSVQEFIDYALKIKLYRHERETTKSQAISVTTTASNAGTGTTEYRPLIESEIRKKIYDIVKGRAQKGYITLKTNLGDMNFKMHCDLTPITCENFIELSHKKYYNTMKFHRLVHDFMLQGGDPTGTGRGGESIYGCKFEDEFHPKLTHNQPGLLSMANSGPGTNGSQFFITLSECDHLDNKHSIFGELMGGMPTLYKINSVPVSKEKPQEEIILEEVIVHQNPFRDAVKKLKEEEKEKQDRNNNELQSQKRKDRWIEDLDGFQPVKKVKGVSEKEQAEQQTNKQKKGAGLFEQIMSQGPVEAKKRNRTQFDFSNW